jgi:transcription elongation factor Elf1
MSTLLTTTLQLPNAFNIPNTNSLTQSLNSIKIDANTNLCSCDIVNMYTNIPTTEVINITKYIIDHDLYIEQEVKHELPDLVNVILEQNHIQFNDHFYKKQWGIVHT